MWQVYTAAETPSAQAEYDDRKRPKPKVWPKNYFYIQPKPNIGRICTTAHIRPPKPKRNFGRPFITTKDKSIQLGNNYAIVIIIDHNQLD